jgi:hypothetical protein
VEPGASLGMVTKKKESNHDPAYNQLLLLTKLFWVYKKHKTQAPFHSTICMNEAVKLN